MVNQNKIDCFLFGQKENLLKQSMFVHVPLEDTDTLIVVMNRKRAIERIEVLE